MRKEYVVMSTFSWSPTGVLRNVLSPATYLQNNKVRGGSTGGSQLLLSCSL